MKPDLTYTCPACKKPLHQNHVYPVALDTCLSRLTQAVPMHLHCARAITQVHDHSQLWIIRSSSWNAPTARLVCLDGVCNFYLQSPLKIEFWEGTRPSTYDKIKKRLMPVLKEATDKAQNDVHELADITRQIAWLHRFLPPSPKAKNHHS